jgi:hypothetical protein
MAHKRIYTAAELDTLVDQEITVDAPDAVYRNFMLNAVRKDGRFEIYGKDGKNINLHLGECKVFVTI